MVFQFQSRLGKVVSHECEHWAEHLYVTKTPSRLRFVIKGPYVYLSGGCALWQTSKIRKAYWTQGGFHLHEPPKLMGKML